MPLVGFDIETKPLHRKELEELCPVFSEKDVRLGRLKDPAKIDAKLKQAKDEHFDKFAEKAGLDPWKSRLLVIGLYHGDTAKFEMIHERSEQVMLERFWELFRQITDRNMRMCGHNIFDFDLPYLLKRSWALDISVPGEVMQLGGSYPRWHFTFIDTLKLFKLGVRDAESNFDYVGRALNTGGKESNHHGKDFHKIWDEDRETALRYLVNDCRKPVEWAKKMGFR